ncbi:glycosyl hydrolase [Aporhodopirellula aestuarii]|uniref:Glycoside hydrolase family protein n=1 Tax=Aporhodopirellula aestuarii TaxID=2950107 RepID=A0ABT0U9T6_9BACT|nr:glycosyl hydrolase [Aporhodopirellula aestuarii]MCM2373449.1 glycoside hydrolase family protein [Aporhodopirellula aestuarii]
MNSLAPKQTCLSRRTGFKCAAVGLLSAGIPAFANGAGREQTDSESTPNAVDRTTTKKGICGKGSNCELTRANWYYNWYWQPTPGQRDAEFVPMIKGKIDAIDRSFARIETLKKSHKITHLLGFNEPDSAKQGNTSVERAIELWPRLMETELRLGSPAVTDNRRGKDWFNAFMQAAKLKRLRIDFIAVHRYPNVKANGSIKGFLASLQKVYATYRKPIWITEFAGLNFGSKDRKMTVNDNLRFMRQVLPELERLPYVERYAWFSSGPRDISSLYDPSQPSGLSPLGTLYRNAAS